MSPGGTRRFGALGAADVAALDGAAVASGVSVLQLMEIAGFQVARCAWRLAGERRARITAVAGRGNNGGDALVAARHLAAWGCPVRAVILTEPGDLPGPLGDHRASAERNGVAVQHGTDAATVARAVRDAEMVLDGILGTGLHSAPREPQASAIRAVNDAGRRVLAIDVPSGLDASSGMAFDPCIRAAATCTLTAMKAGLWEATARGVAGEVWAADIAMPAAAWSGAGLEPPADLRGGVLLQVPSATLP